MPCFPVDSASSCSSQAPKSAMPGEATTVTLLRPAFASCAMITPSFTPGFSPGGTLGPQDRTINCADVSKLSMSIPIRAAGTMPKSDRTE